VGEDEAAIVDVLGVSRNTTQRPLSRRLTWAKRGTAGLGRSRRTRRPGRRRAKFAGLFHASTHGCNRSPGRGVARSASSAPPQLHAASPMTAAMAAFPTLMAVG
jgi:hypothetical protein